MDKRWQSEVIPFEGIDPKGDIFHYVVTDPQGDIRAAFRVGPDADRYVRDRNREQADAEDRAAIPEERRQAAYRALTDQELQAPGPLLADFADTVLVEVAEIDLEEPDADDHLHEIADAAVPTYTSDLIRCFTEDVSLAQWESEILAYDGTPTVVNIAAGVLYELALNIASAALQERRDDAESEGE